VYRINIILFVAVTIACTGCGVNISNENMFTATPDFVTATLRSTLTPVATKISVSRTSTVSSTVGAPTITPIEGTTTTQVNVRAETSTASETLGLIGQFAKVQIIGKDASGSWYQIVYPDSGTGYGWVRAEYVQVNAPAEIPPVENVTGNGSGVSGLVIQKINVRNGPGTTYDSLGVLSPNDVVSVTGKDPESKWLQIIFSSAPDGKGWVASEFLQADNLDTLPVVGSSQQITETPSSVLSISTATTLSAIQDGDSMDAPTATAAFSSAGMHILQVTGNVSSPGGDTEDWVQFTSTGKAITLQLTCSGDALNVELWSNSIFEKDLSPACGAKQTIVITPNNKYFLRLSEATANDLHYTHYILSLET